MTIKQDLHLCPSLLGTDFYTTAKNTGILTLGVCPPLWDTAVGDVPCDFYKGKDANALFSLSLPKEDGVRILCGCEAEMDKDGKIGLSEKTAEKLDYVLVSHSHADFDEIASPETRKDVKRLAHLLCQRFSMLVENPLANHITAISHPFFPGKTVEDCDEVLFRISDAYLEDVFADAVYHNIALEINADAFSAYPIKGMHRSELFRIYETAKEAGCKFVFGTDCPDPALYGDYLKRLNILADLLEITEQDLCLI